MDKPSSTILKHDVVRGVVLTDGLIGTFTSAYDLQANKCFLYHLIGNGTGEWKVPQGGMGALVRELERVALASGVSISTNSRVTAVQSDEKEVLVSLENGNQFSANYLPTRQHCATSVGQTAWEKPSGQFGGLTNENQYAGQTIAPTQIGR